MSGTFSVTVQEARGAVAVPADLDNIAVVIGCSSAGSGLSPFFLNATAAIANRGYGDAVDALTQILEQRQSDGSSDVKVPAAMWTTPVDTTGAYGTIDTSGVTGTSVVTTDGAVDPFGTYEAKLIVVVGGTIGVTGITLRWSLDNGRTLSRVTALGTANNFTIPNSNVKFLFAAGTLVAGDEVFVRTFAPQPAAADIDDAFVALANASANFTIVVLEFPITAALAANVTTGLNELKSRGKRCVAICRTRLPDFEAAETEAAWGALIEANFIAFEDSRIVVRAAYGLITDAVTSRQYLRSTLAQLAADTVRVDRGVWPSAPADRPEPNVTLVDADGVDVGHDEGPRGAFTGLSNDTLGNRFSCEQRLPDPQRLEDVFNTVPWVMYASDEQIRNLPTRRLANAIERVAASASIPSLGSKLFFVSTGPSTGTLTDTSREAVHATVYAAIKSEFGTEISNAEDAAIDNGLVQVNQDIGVSGGNLLAISGNINPKIGGFVLSLDWTLSVQE